MQKQCKCGKMFHTKIEHRKFCTECASKLQFHRYLPRQCKRAECRQEFIPRRSWQIYCCVECQSKEYNNAHDITRKMKMLRAKRRVELFGEEEGA